MNRSLNLAGACAALAVAGYILLPSNISNEEESSSKLPTVGLVSIQVPPLEGNAAVGARIFENACATCHGSNASGIEGAGPPLVHKIYKPSHHSDESFQRAVARGVKSHHWRFGDMPRITGLTRGDVTMVIAYIRQVQRANGIN
ncbi:c-type cytochrome [Roseobacter sp. SK209-2-6]|uniref:c-type cytochrome n=1 Tax=Roseobacter sp. SK209-2-6 TaxID=388739 RepID=UPI000A05601A|nr:cytochrome c [Roseobacter sp. SK209-2-6]